MGIFNEEQEKNNKSEFLAGWVRLGQILVIQKLVKIYSPPNEL